MKQELQHFSLNQKSIRQSTSSWSSAITPWIFRTAATFLSRGSKGSIFSGDRLPLTVKNLHESRVRDAGLVQAKDDELEVNWSGFGMHVQFSEQMEVPLVFERELAQTCQATVNVVHCNQLPENTFCTGENALSQEVYARRSPEKVKHLAKVKQAIPFATGAPFEI